MANCRTTYTMMGNTNGLIDADKLQESAAILRAIAHPLRLRIMEFIDDSDMINVNRIYNTLNLEQSVTSQHLRVLRKAGLVEARRDGKYIHYQLEYGRIKNVTTALNRFLDEDEQ